MSAGRRSVWRLDERAGVQLAAVGGLGAIVVLLAAAHLAVMARPAFVAGGLILALLARRRSPESYVTLTLWFWTLSPLIRRLVDYAGGFVVTNLVLVTPNLICIVMLVEIATSPVAFRRREASLALLAVLAMLYGFVLSAFAGGVLPALVSAADWICPAAYFFFLVMHAGRVEGLARSLATFVPLNLLVVGGYGLWQYLRPPPWDAAWVLNSEMINLGRAVPYGLKPFATLNNPAFAAIWLGVLSLLSLSFRDWRTLAGLPVALLVIGLTLVRSAVGMTALAFAMALGLGRGPLLRSGLLVAGTMVLAVAIGGMLDPRAGTAMLARFSTVGRLDQDNSARARAALYQEAPGLIADHPLGLGLGALGRGAVAGAEPDLVTVDSGPLAIYLALGWVGGTLYLLGFVGCTVQALVMAVSSRSASALVAAAAAVASVSLLLFANVVGFQGVVTWFLAGYGVAASMRARVIAAPLAREAWRPRR